MRTKGLFKAVRPDGRSRNGLDWNVPIGTVVRADHNVAEVDHGAVCPRHEGDGISIVKTWKGAAQTGFPTARCCTVAINEDDILAEDGYKVRVRAVTVTGWFDAPGLLRRGCARGAYLYGANLSGADLSGADLSRACLSSANLYGANLIGANLSGVDLSRANLSGTGLSGVYLAGADLSRADLSRADLSYADLSGADLAGANLSGADLGDWERSPDGFARKKDLP